MTARQTMTNERTFSQSQTRPLSARLQPVTWLMAALVLVFAGLAGITLARGRERAMRDVGQPMGTPVAAIVDSANGQATRTPWPSATVRPTRTPRPTADKTATFFAQLGVRQTAAVKKSTAEARATQAIATFTPSPPTPTIYPAGYRAPWADKMVKQADGTWMAPKEVVDEAARQYSEYYAWLKTRDRKFIALPDEIQMNTYERFLTGGVLDRRRLGMPKSEVDNILKDPKTYSATVLKVRGFSADGLQAVCDIEFRNSEWLSVNATNGKLMSEFSLPDRIDSDLLVYDPAARRWKWAGTLASVPLKQ
jgi:hypothetical protein